ncbi:type I polyketide synthase [Krasilnikovia sp. MM14-A1259]|uniref:type I polyketide synthase n=1 Tax=Krasilnikovia sp. MM14-A1259 TaxID=3373539 RepID=UPI00381C532B
MSAATPSPSTPQYATSGSHTMTTSNEDKLRAYLKRAIADAQDARARLHEVEARAAEPLAIVGLSCRFPGGAGTPEQFWELLAAGGDAVGALPTDRGWDIEHLYDPADGPTTAQSGAFLTDATTFDAGFFGISPREASAMDPQQRLLLEVSWEALERAGIDPAGLRGSTTGVFAGGFASGYLMLAGQAAAETGSGAEKHLMTGNATSVLSGRISYVLGLEGPAVSVDTACSSSLVALHLAVQSLRAGECSLALAGGATVMVTPGMFIEFSRQQGLSSDGRCRAFSDDADGTGWGEGAGMLVLERLSDARRNGHPVLAVIRGSAINQDGASNGITAPNGPSQQRVIRAALANARLSGADVDVVEAHGTGTTLGDPIEAQALLATYGRDRAGQVPLWLGTVKSNIGHTQAAAGVAGVIKMVLALQNGKLPATLHAEEPSSHIDWTAGDVRLLREPVAWPSGERVRRAGVSAFGISGTNAHVIVEEAPAEEDTAAPEARTPVVSDAAAWLVSARSAEGLAGQAGRLREWVLAHPETAPADVAWSLATTRSKLEHRAVVVGKERDDLLGALANLATGQTTKSVTDGVARPAVRVGLIFAGQGSQWSGMGRSLYEGSAVFAEAFDEVCALLDVPVRDLVLGADGVDGSVADQTLYAQTGLFAFEVALAAVVKAAGVTAHAVVGHSVGEIAAAYVAGVLSLPDACRLVAARARAMQECPAGGAMAAINVAEADVVATLVDGVEVASVNGPESVVVSGAAEGVARVLEHWRAQGCRVKQLRVSHAFHSAAMEPALASLDDVAAGLPHHRPTLLWAGALDGALVGEPGGGYWAAQTRGAVRFGDALATLAGQGVSVFLEVGPDGSLSSLGPDAVAGIGGDEGVFIPLQRRKQAEGNLLTGLARAYVHGVTVDWSTLLPSGERIGLPTYAFQRERYWPERSTAGPDTGTGAEAEFWTAVDNGDLSGLADALDLPDQQVGDLMPALASWRRRAQDRSVTAGWRYQVSWAPLTEPDHVRLTGRWLVVGAGQAAEEVAAALTARGAVVVAIAGPADLSPAGDVAGVVSLLGLDEAPTPEFPEVPQGLAATLALVQALGAAGIGAPLWLVTRGAVAAGPGEALTSPVQAQIWGLGRVVALEHPDRWGGLIDLPPVTDERAGRKLAAVLAGVGEDQVVIRASAILGRRLTRPSRFRGSADDWRTGGSTLITGGTGAIGGHVARWLAAHHAPRLVLTSRSGPAAPGAATLAAALATAGSRTDIVAADVSHRADVTGLLAWTGATGPTVSAVMHTAGVLDDGVVERQSPARLATVLRAKATSADLLDELTADLDLDAFVLFSSVAATLGAAGQGNYAAANAYLDALAENRRARGKTGLSIAWGVWGGGGFAESSEAVRARTQRLPMPAMDPQLAVRALFEAVQGATGVLAVMDVDWAQLATGPGAGELRQAPLVRDLPEVRRLPAAATTTVRIEGALAQRLTGLNPAEQERLLTDVVRAEVALVLGHASAEAVAARRAFKELGFDSLTAVELRNRLNTATGLRLPATLIFDYPTPLVLAQFLRGELTGQPGAVAAGSTVTATALDEPIAIVGLGCRFPGGAATPDRFWRLLSEGRDAVSGFPGDRGWDLDDISYAAQGGFLDEVADFDADFFGISPREALAMDPQQRLLLELSWEALERAGIDPDTLRGSSTGVFAGGFSSGYNLAMALTGGAATAGVEGHMLTGNATSVLSGRVSYALGLEGPAVTVDTACSSSLVALHLAVQALRAGECSLALAGGVTVMATPNTFADFSRQQGLSVDGRCRAFSADADGTGWGEGAGVLVVERLSDAQRLGHPVLAVVRGSAVNQDGASNGLTAPNGPSQQRVIRAALASAGLVAADVDVVEAHGTGTTLGDPIEAQALLATYGQGRLEGRPVWLGSVKSNIGHTQAAAGVAGLIKMVLALQHGELPRTLHADVPSPHIDWSAGEVRLLNEPVSWTGNGRVRRAGVSSFGMSGTNAHVILEEAPADDVADPEEPTPVVSGAGAWVISGRSADGLAAQAERLWTWTNERPELTTADVAWSLVRTRSTLEHRAVVIGSDRDELAAGLADLSGPVVSGVARGPARPVFVFPGQGSQWVGMGRDLAAVSPVFAARLAECEQALAPHVGWSLTDMLSREDQWTDADVVQPLLWAVMVSLAAVWESAGVVPDAVVGHSQGEIAAATVAGMLSLEDAAKVVALRSQTLRAISGAGAMMSVALSAAAVEPRLHTRVALAAVNGPESVVLSGEPGALQELQARFEAEGVRARMVAVDYASHGPQVDPLERDILAALDGISPQPGRVPMVSAMSGDTLTGTELDAVYWYASLRNPVQFERAVRTLAGSGHDLFIEVTPHPVLLGAIGDTLDDVAGHAGPGAVPGAVCGTLRRDDGGVTRLVTSFAEAFVAGAAVDWTRVLPVAATVELPTYAFRHERYWPQGRLTLPAAGTGGDPVSLGQAALGHPLLGAAVELPGGEIVCTGRLSVRSQPWLADHTVGGLMLLPGTAFVELAVRAGDQAGCGVLEELTLQAPLVVPADGGVQVQVVLGTEDEQGRRGVEIFSRPDEPGTSWAPHASGTLTPAPQETATDPDLTAWPPRDADAVDLTDFYRTRLSAIYGPAFHGLQSVWRRGDDLYADVALPDEVAADAGAFGIHPVLLDAAMHAAVLTGDVDSGVRMPFAWTGVQLHAAGASVLRVRLRRNGDDSLTLTAADTTGAPVVSVASLLSRPVTAPPEPAASDALYTCDWVPVTLAESDAPDDWALLGADRFGAAGTLPVHAGVDDVVTAATTPSVVVLCVAGEDTGERHVGEAARQTAGSVLALVQEWLAEPAVDAVPLLVLTRGAVAAADGEGVRDLAGAAVWGLLRSAQSENPGRLILADLLDSDVDAATLAAVLGSGEPEVALRGPVAYGRRIVRPAATEAVPDSGETGTILVTGGTGTLGGLVAAHLVATGRARGVTLLSRSGPASAGAPALAADLATAGARVQVIAADAADRDALAAVLATIPADLPLRSVFHAAGVIDDGVVATLTPERLAAVMRPKTDAAWYLHELTSSLELDHFVMFSSAAATFGAAGQGNYVAANSFLDGLASYRQATGLAGLSLQWGPWVHEAGIGRNLDEVSLSRISRSGLSAMGAAEGLGVFDRALTRPEAVLIPARLDLETLRRQAADSGEVPPLWRVLSGVRPAAARRTAAGAAVSTGEVEELRRRLAAMSVVERDRFLLDLVQRRVAAVLGHASVDRIEAGRAFTDLGFDSLTAVDLRNRLRFDTGLRLPATLVFDYPTPAALAVLLRTELVGDTAAETDTPVYASAGLDEPVAIVGMACRFPGGVSSPDELWQVLTAGTDTIGSFPVDRGWDLDALYDADSGTVGTSYTRKGGFVSEASAFDAGFFSISPREAVAMDPQQRLLLETSWEALERAGIDPRRLRGTQTGAFIGGYSSGYAAMSHEGSDEFEGIAAHLMTGNATSVLSGRLSYTFGLEGPAVTVDTACSSSLVALHLAVQALRAGECSLALAGGVTLMVTPDGFIGFSQARGLAVDGRSKAFGADADGMGMAEGVGMLVVERLSDARRLGHRVLAVVRGSAVNQDGASNGITAPNGPSQQRVIRAALAGAQLTTADIDVVEAHGTGTTLGDPIEAQALLATYGRGRPQDRPVWLGSVKSNIGHTQAAAGVAGVMKMVLALQHDELPRTLFADVPSPHIDWTAGDVRLLNEPIAWPSGERVRRAGVSSFGMSGTNAHVILEEAPAHSPDERAEEHTPVVAASTAWVVSGRSAQGLDGQAARLREWLTARPEPTAADVAWSLASTRSFFEHRAVVIGGDRGELAAGLADLSGPAVTGVARSQPGTVFVFPGQGSQWVGMGRELASVSPVFAARLGECERALAPYVGWSLTEMLSSDGQWTDADVVQPLLWAVMVSLAAVWEAAGVTPDAVVGHSQGEIAAATVAGMLSVEDAAKVVALRSQTLKAISGAGGMMSVAASAATVEPRLGGRVALAAVNGPASVVVSGEPDALQELQAAFEAEGVRARMVAVDYASHGPQVDVLEEEILSVLASVAPRAGRVPMVSAMSGETLTGTELDAAYWYASLRNPVQFERAVRTLAGSGHDLFVEVTPHPVLLGAIGDTVEDAVVTGTLRRDDGGATRLLTSLAEAFVAGASVDWTRVLPAAATVELPTYAFRHERYWPQGAAVQAVTASTAGTPAEAEFWTAVENGDVAQLADTLELPDRQTIGELLPALTSWRRREQDRSVTANWRYRVGWSPVAEPDPGVLSGSWLVVAGPASAGRARECEHILTSRGADVRLIEVPAGATGRDDLAGLIGEPGPVAGVLSLLAVDEEYLPDFPIVPRGLAATLALVQALGDLDVEAPLWVATCGAIAGAPGESPASLVQAQTWGLGRVVGIEHGDRWGGLIDLPEVLDDRAGARLVAVLSHLDEDQTTIRPSGILGRRLSRAALPRGAADDWRTRGGVLITGGTGAIGGHVARWLAGHETSRLILTSRSGPSASGAAALAAELAIAGADVDVVACDAGDRGELAGLLAWTSTSGVPVSAVMHTAGVLDDGVVERQSPERLATVLAAKAVSAALLDELTGDLDLDAFVLFSSAASTLGSAGQGNYAAANAYLDALAEDRRSRGLAGLSVAWGLWGGGGLAESKEAIRNRMQRLPLPPMDPQLGVRALFEALQGNDAVLTVMDVDWPQMLAGSDLATRPFVRDIPEVRQLAAASAAKTTEPAMDEDELARRLSRLTRPEQERLLADLVRTEAAKALGHGSADDVQARTSFKDLGFDSLSGVELRNRLNTATGLRLPATLVFDYPTPQAFAAWLLTELAPGEKVSVPILDDLDRLEAGLAAARADQSVHEDVTRRLRTILSKWIGDRQHDPEPEKEAVELRSATPDQLFDYLDKELGLSS